MTRKHNKKSFQKSFLCTILTVTVAFSAMAASACGGGLNLFQIPESQLPVADAYALKKYSYDELSDSQVTVRADEMKVTERGLPRAETQILGDDFSLVYDTEKKTIDAEYGMVETSGSKKTATITFTDYPSPSHHVGGANAFSNAKMSGEPVSVTNDQYYKYMLMTQGQHLAQDAARYSAKTASDEEGVNREFKNWLKKHPSADAQYGAVLGENNAVEKEIILDPIYRSPHVSGLYLPAGEAVTVKVEGLAAGERLGVTLGYQNSLAWRGGVNDSVFNGITGGINKVTSYSCDQFFTKGDVLLANNKMTEGQNTYVNNEGHWKSCQNRAPWVGCDFTFSENKTYTIGSPFGGLIHIEMKNCYSAAKITITGAVETPHYILGVTTPEYFDEYLRQAPGVIAVLDTENCQIVGPTGVQGTGSGMRQIKKDEVDKLAMLWHSFHCTNESFNGGAYNAKNIAKCDHYVPAGLAVALGGGVTCNPVYFFDNAMNYRGLLSGGHWGLLHEIGHNHSSAYGIPWGFCGGQEGEVRNNALIVLSYIQFCDTGTTVRHGGGVEHGFAANPYSCLSHSLNLKNTKHTDFNDYGYFDALSMYANIMHSFGADKYYELLYSYKIKSSYIEKDGVQNPKRPDFAYRCALTYGMNFIKYFNTYYKANITDGMFTEEQLSYMNNLPNYEPVACYYAGGIDGVKTAGDYKVAFGENIKFDLKKNTISTFDDGGTKGFEIVSIEQPEHGRIKAADLANGTCEYEFDKEYTGVFDEFSFTVKLADGVCHKFTVTLRISYNGANVSCYKNIQANVNDWDEVISEVESREPDEVISVPNSYIPTYHTETGNEVRVAEFYWRAPKSGTIAFSAKCDDRLTMYFGDSFDSIEQIGRFSKYINGYGDYSTIPKKEVEEGRYYAVKLFNVNTGGDGSASMAIKYDGDDGYSVFGIDDVFTPTYPLGREAEKYIFEPNYIISKKDNIKLSATGTDKSEWSVLEAPYDLVGGRYYKEQMLVGYEDEEKTKPIYEEHTTDRWNYLIDGQTGSNLHTSYPRTKITADNPHIFIIDTAEQQQFNYFAVTTRDNVNSYITDCELFIASELEDFDREAHKEKKVKEIQGDWKSLGTADRNSYSGQTITFKFDNVEGRYLKLVVKGTSTDLGFSVLAELDAGIKSSTEVVVPLASDKLFLTDGWTKANGTLVAEKTNAKMVMRFRGDNLSVYAKTGEGYGSAKVIIDGRECGTFDLDSDIGEKRKLVFLAENLENKEHTVEIITTSSNPVTLTVLGIPYSASILNAANIYKENALTVALVVFVLLFALLVAFVCLCVFLPKFRNFIFGNSLIKKLDNREKKPKTDNKDKTAPEPVKKTATAAKPTEKSKPKKPTDSTETPKKK